MASWAPKFKRPEILCTVCKKACKKGDGTDIHEKWVYGPVMEKGKFVGHYFCVLFMDGLVQCDSDEIGICGFRLEHIQKQVKARKTQICCFCGDDQAIISCQNYDCNKTFHYVCAIDNQCLGVFKSDMIEMFCPESSKFILDAYFDKSQHKDVPDFDGKADCKLCFDTLDDDNTGFNSFKFIYMPCCYYGYLHRACLQRTAYTSGYAFKCPDPECGDDRDWLKDKIRALGIFIPARDALWETEELMAPDLEDSQINMTYDNMFPIEDPLPVMRSYCDYPRCLDYWRDCEEKPDGVHTLKCKKCKTAFAHKKCLIYFMDLKLDKSKTDAPPSAKELPPFTCRSCFSKTCLSQI